MQCVCSTRTRYLDRWNTLSGIRLVWSLNKNRSDSFGLKKKQHSYRITVEYKVQIAWLDQNEPPPGLNRDPATSSRLGSIHWTANKPAVDGLSWRHVKRIAASSARSRSQTDWSSSPVTIRNPTRQVSGPFDDSISPITQELHHAVYDLYFRSI